MLVVPRLAWPILFGQNHLWITKAHTDHSGLKVHFADPPMNFTVTCRDTNPLDEFLPLRNQTSSSAPPGISISPSPGPLRCQSYIFTQSYAFPCPSQLPHLPSSWVQFSHTLFSDDCLSCWFHLVLLPPVVRGEGISPGLQIISGPFDMNAISSGPSLAEPSFLQTEGHNYPKCRPSHMLPPLNHPLCKLEF